MTTIQFKRGKRFEFFPYSKKCEMPKTIPTYDREKSNSKLNPGMIETEA